MGALLAVAIILIFLGSGTSTLIIAHSIPISIIATFVLLHFGKFTLNIMTLGGLAFGVGRLVDDAIVVLENINRHIERGESPEEASYKGAREVSKPVIAATITSIVVFTPLRFRQGDCGTSFRSDGLYGSLLPAGISLRFTDARPCSHGKIPQTQRSRKKGLLGAENL